MNNDMLLRRPAACVSLLAGVFCLQIALAQSGITVAGFGYQNPGKTIIAAPGQVMTVSVFGVAGRFPGAFFPISGSSGLPTVVESMSVNFVQGPVTDQLPIRGVQQSSCPATGDCSPATTITIQIPYDLNPDSGVPATLEIDESGTLIAEVDIKAVEDSVHIINTCDQTGIYLSVAYQVPAGTCVPMVEHANGQLISASLPAMPGETLLLWAFGLGAITPPSPIPCCGSSFQIPQAVQPFTIGFSYIDPTQVPLQRLAQVTPSFVGMVGEGTYQVEFVVPPAPASLAPCSSGSGNVKLLLSGPNSADGAGICLK
jgi:uncharacterized protein (TIGR03437 family)